MVSALSAPRTVTVSPRWAITDTCGSRPYMTRLVSSYKASLAPGTSLAHSGDSAKASSALQLLETRMPDQDDVFGLLLWPAAVMEAKERIASERKSCFAKDWNWTDRISSVALIRF